MRKIVAISILLILSFNWFGYRFVFDYLENRHNLQFESELDSDGYNENELISIRTAFALPYFVNSNKFERWNGEIEINGIQYKYVKRRFYNDSLELLCIPNYKGMQLKKAEQNYFRFANDIQQNDQNKKQGQNQLAFKNMLSEFCQDIPEWDFAIGKEICFHQSHYSFYSSEFIGDSRGQPPDAA